MIAGCVAHRIAQTSREKPVESLECVSWEGVLNEWYEVVLFLDDGIGLVGVDQRGPDGHANGGQDGYPGWHDFRVAVGRKTRRREDRE